MSRAAATSPGRTQSVPVLRGPVVVRSPAAPGGAAPRRRRAARRAILWGAAAVALAQLALATALETALPQLRDPEYGYRLVRALALQRAHPDRPLVLVLGTSRTQNAIDPAAMGFPDEPGSPLVFNGGLSGASPLHLRLALQRFRADGVKPAAVLVELFPATLTVTGPADGLFADREGRLTSGDLRRLRPYADDPAGLCRRWAAARLGAWQGQRAVIVSHLAPHWQPWQRRVTFQWEATDRFGFGPYPAGAVTAESRQERRAQVRADYEPALRELRVSELTDRALRDLIADCRAAGVPLAFFVAPESHTFRSWYTPDSRRALRAYTRALTDEFGCPVFEAPDDYAEEDFADGHHILPPAAARFSRWLADVHLKQWLAPGR